MPESRAGKFLADLIPGLLVFLITGLTFSVLLNADFCAVDDPDTITANPRMNPPTVEGIGYYWRHAEGDLYIPVTYTVWGLLASIARTPPDELGVTLNPAVFHGFNILVHACAAVLVFVILKRLIPNRTSAVLGALLFAVHPIQVEAVAWVSGLKDVLSAALGLAAMWQYICAVVELDQFKRKLHYGLATAAMLLAMLAKPSAMMVPAIVLVIDALLLRRSFRTVIVWLIPWFVAAAVCAIVTMIAQPAIPNFHAPLWARPFIAGDSLAFYLYKLFWPRVLLVDYSRTPEAVMNSSMLYLIWLVPLVIALLLFMYRKKLPELSAAGAIFALAILPVLGLVTFLFQHFSTTADHYLYPAMLGPALALAWVIHRFGTNRVGAVIAGALLLGLAARSAFQARLWRNDLSLYQYTLENNSRSVFARGALGAAALRHNRPDLAAMYYSEAAEIYPDDPSIWERQAQAFEQLGRFNEAISLREKVARELEMHPGSYEGDIAGLYVILGMNLLNADRPAEARDYFRKALRLVPDDTKPGVSRLLERVEWRLSQTTTGPSTKPQ